MRAHRIISRPDGLTQTRGRVAAALCGLLLVAACALPARAQRTPADTTQTREVHLRADSLAGSDAAGRVRRLFGNVHLRQGETLLWAQEATQYLDRKEILFTGDVRIVERGDSLWADRVLYNTATKTGEAEGHLRLTDGDVVVLAPTGVYHTEEKRAVFDRGVTLVDSTNTLKSRGGIYWSDEKRAEFYGDVRLDEPRTHLEADSVTYHRETEVALARGRVYIERVGGEEEEEDADTTLRTLLFGERAYNDNKAGYSRIEGEPLLVQLRRDSTGAEVDTLLIRAVQLEVSRQDSLQRLVAVDSVRIWQQRLAAVADSVVYDRIRADGAPAREEARLYRDPMAWFNQSQVSGDTIRVQARDASVDTLFVYGRTFVAQMDTVLNRVQQLQGEDLVAVFADDSLRTLRVGPQAEAINFRSDEQDQPAGAVRMSADRIIFHFAADALQRVSAVRGIEGTFYAESLLPDPFRLGRYVWVPERRPTRVLLMRAVQIPPPVVAAPPPAVALSAGAGR